MTSLSIIIVNYKSWSVLEKCLESILSQGIDDIEVIIVDNNSNDGLITKFKKNISTLNGLAIKLMQVFPRLVIKGQK